MSDNGDCGGGDSGGGGCDSSCGAPDSSDHRDSCHNDPHPSHSSHSSEDCHSTGKGSFNDDAGNISSDMSWKNKGKYTMNSQTKKAEVQKDDCCCTLI